MSKPNKMGMSHDALMRSRAARYGPKTPEEAKERENLRRSRSPDLYALMDAVRDGTLTPDEATAKLKEMEL